MRRHQSSQRLQGGPKPHREGALEYSGLMAARPVAPKVDWERKVRRPARREASSGESHLPKDLFRPLGRERQLDGVGADRQLHPQVAFGRGLRLGGLRLEPEQAKKSATAWWAESAGLPRPRR